MMVTLYLLRHAKASSQTLLGPGFSAESYDALHAQGVEQARLLGASLAKRGRSFDRVVCGPMRRHIETFQLLRDAAPELDWPEVEPCETLREIALDALIQARLPELIQRVPTCRSIWDEVGREPAGTPVTEASPF